MPKEKGKGAKLAQTILPLGFAFMEHSPCPCQPCQNDYTDFPANLAYPAPDLAGGVFVWAPCEAFSSCRPRGCHSFA